MPAYREYSEDLQIPPSYDLTGITLRSFELSADPNKLQTLCDEQLNIGKLQDRGFCYKPVLPYVAMEILHYDRMTSSYGPFANMGYTSQNELYIRFPVWKYVLLGNFLVPVSIHQFFPILFVDNMGSVLSGREVVGFPKRLASFQQTTAPDGTYTAEMVVSAFPTYGPTSKETPVKVLTIEAGPSGPLLQALPPWPWTILETGNLLPSWAQFAIQSANLYTQGISPTVQFKQIRDAEVQTQACYQAIVTGSFKVTRLYSGQWLPSASVDISTCASLDLVNRFGLTAAQPIKPVLAYQLRFDMTYSDVQNEFVNTGP